MGIIGKIDGARAIDRGGLESSRIVEQLTAFLLGTAYRNNRPWAGIRLPGI